MSAQPQTSNQQTSSAPVDDTSKFLSEMLNVAKTLCTPSSNPAPTSAPAQTNQYQGTLSLPLAIPTVNATTLADELTNVTSDKIGDLSEELETSLTITHLLFQFVKHVGNPTHSDTIILRTFEKRVYTAIGTIKRLMKEAEEECKANEQRKQEQKKSPIHIYRVPLSRTNSTQGQKETNQTQPSNNDNSPPSKPTYNGLRVVGDILNALIIAGALRAQDSDSDSEDNEQTQEPTKTETNQNGTDTPTQDFVNILPTPGQTTTNAETTNP
jgi:hypothetical protein